MPRTLAARRSDCRAILLRSRQVNWQMGSIPRSRMTLPRGRGPSLITEAFWSVTLTASTEARESRIERTGSMLTPLGGVTSAVTKREPEFSFSLKPGKNLLQSAQKEAEQGTNHI